MRNKYPKRVFGISIVSLLALWALWFFSYRNFQYLLKEMETLPNFYGIHLYKEHVRGPIERFAKVIIALQGDKVLESPEDYENLFLEHDLEMLVLFAGLGTPFVVVQMKTKQVLYPSGPPFEKASFLNNANSTKAFFHKLETMAGSDTKAGYFFTDFVDPLAQKNSGLWFLSVAQASEGLLCILLVPEEKLKQSGKVLQEAQSALILKKQKRYLLRTLPLLCLISLLIFLLSVSGFRRHPYGPIEQEQT